RGFYEAALRVKPLFPSLGLPWWPPCRTCGELLHPSMRAHRGAWAPAHDKKRGVRHYLCDDRSRTKPQTVLITPYGGTATRGRSRDLRRDGDRLIVTIVTPERIQDPREPSGERDHRDASAAPRRQALDPGMQRGAPATLAPDHPRRLNQHNAQRIGATLGNGASE